MTTPPLLMPIFPCDVEERDICLAGLRPGGWLRASIECLARYESDVYVSAESEVEKMLKFCDITFVSHFAGRDINPLLPSGAETLLTSLLSDKGLHPDHPVVIHDYRFPLALGHLPDILHTLTDGNCAISVVEPRDHPVQAMQAYDFLDLEVLLLNDGDTNYVDSEQRSHAFRFIGTHDTVQGKSGIILTEGWFSRVIPQGLLNLFSTVSQENIVSVISEGVQIRRFLTNSRIDHNDLEIVAWPALRTSGRAMALGVRRAENNRLLIFVEESVLEQSISLLGTFFTDRFTDLRMLYSQWNNQLGPLKLSFNGQTFLQVGHDNSIPDNSTSIVLAFMKPISPEGDIFWLENIQPCGELWSTLDGVVYDSNSDPITCSQRFPKVWTPCSALTGGPAGALSNLSPESCRPICLNRLEGLRMSNALAMIQHAIFSKGSAT